MNPLAWIGRQRGRALAAALIIAVLTPPLGAALEPLLTPSIVALLCVAFMRTSLASLQVQSGRPALVLAGVLWTMLAIPFLMIATCRLVGIDTLSPALYTGLVLQAVASPMMAAPAVAALLGLEASLALTTLILGAAVIPVTAPLFVAFAGLALAIPAASLGIRLLLILAGSALLGFLIRRLVGPARLARFDDHLNGLNIVLLFVFASALMGDVGVGLLTTPGLVLGLTLLTLLVSLALFVLTHRVFLRCGQRTALTLALLATQRNAGLMLAATGGLVPELTWLYFALCQIPFYLAPTILNPVVARLLHRQTMSVQRPP